MKTQIRVDDSEVRQYLSRMPEQIPFAMSKAMNETALDIRNHIVKSVWQSSVGVKQRGFAGRAFRVRWSRKTDLVAAVYADPSRVSEAGIKAIARVEEGIRHYPFRSRYLAVPTFKALTNSGRVKKAAREALNETNPRAFVADLRGRGPAIWQRNNNGTLSMLFVLKPSVPTPKVFPFEREAVRLARLTWPGNVFRAVKLAERTALRSGFSNNAHGRRAAFRISRGRL